MFEVSPLAAARAAYLAAACNLAAVLAIALLLRPGLPGSETTLASRWLFVRAHPIVWWAGWLVWHLAAVALLAFYVALAGLWGRRAPIRGGLALLCAAAGLAADLSAQGLAMGIAPWIDRDGFGIVEMTSTLLTGYLGNGLYTLAGALLTWAGASALPRPLLWLALPTWGAGAALSAASLVHSAEGQALSIAMLFPLFVAWTALVGRWLSRRAS